jgi:hypothetical protein
MVAPAIIAGGLGLLGSLFSSNAANRATRAGVDASQQQMDLYRDIYGQQSEFLSPYRQAGEQGLGQYQNALAFGPYNPGAGFNYQQMQGGQQALSQAMNQLGTPYEESPGYQFQLEQGQRAIDNSAAGRGMTFSGATLRAQQELGQGLAAQDYNNYQNRQMGLMGTLLGQGAYGQNTLMGAQGNYLNRLQGLAAMGQNAATGTGAAAAQFGQMGGQALGNQGMAQMSGAIAQGNAVNSGISNALAGYGYLTQSPV